MNLVTPKAGVYQFTIVISVVGKNHRPCQKSFYIGKKSCEIALGSDRGRGGFVEHLCLTSVAHQSVTIFITVIFMKIL